MRWCVALMALDIQPGDEVLTTPYSFFATAGAVSRVGATPVFVDVEADTFNIDVDRMAATLATRSQATVPRDSCRSICSAGCADMDPIMKIAQRARHGVIEDAAQAIGSAHATGGGPAASGTSAASFLPEQESRRFGDGGIVTTQRRGAGRAADASCGRTAASRSTTTQSIGGNFRLDALQAAVLRVKLAVSRRVDERPSAQRGALRPSASRAASERSRRSAARARATATSTIST